MSAVKAADPRKIFAREDWAAITKVSRWRGIWLTFHAWAVVLSIVTLATWWGNPVGWLLAVILIGGRQLGLSILMHDAAHGHLHPDRKLNNFMGQWLTGAATGSDLQAYRTYHLTHHRFTQQPEDPDLSLSKPFPTSKQSMARKVFRDLTGIVFFRTRYAQAKRALKGIGPAAKEQNVFVGKAFARFLLVQGVLLAISLLVYGWTPFLLWFVALATTFQLFLRIRNIAEHACTTTGSEDPFTHARTTRANWLERTTVAPYWVNFHSEHHMFMGVPCYNLAQAHRLLGQSGYHPRMTIAPHYWRVLRQVTQKRLITSQPS